LSVGRSEAEDHLCFSVSDTGIGMDPNDVSYIFESFRQLDGSYSRRRGGLGLGLSIANKLIQLMGGWINVETHPEKGTTMSVNIPNGEDSHAQHDHAAETGLPRSPENGLAVLVVEDEPINTLYLEELLHTHGCRVTSTRTGEEALSAVKRSSFDIALIDIGLPTISGIETAKRIRLWEQELGSSGHMPIVALTAHAFDEDRDACLAAGMDDFLTKPVDESALFGTIERLARAPDKTSGRD